MHSPIRSLFRPLLVLLAASAAFGQPVRFVGKTKFLNNARVAVVHSIDDSTRYVPAAIDAMDKYGIKSTIFVSTENDPVPEDRFFTQLQIRGLWPRLRQAIADGHEIGSHSRQHPCKKPDDESFCDAAYSAYEITGSRDDILRLTQQPYVWSWCYPCGNCATYPFIQKRIADAGYIVARNYPNELTNGHVRPGVRDFDGNPMNAGYTQVVQHRNAAKSDLVDSAAVQAEFDRVYAQGGVYHFMSHPQWLDYGASAFYESHMSYVAGRADAWYVPMGPLYAFREIRDRTTVKSLQDLSFALSNGLDPRIYGLGTLTLEFEAPDGFEVLANGQLLPRLPSGPASRWDRQFVRRDGSRLFVTAHSNTTLEFFRPSGLTSLDGTWKLRYRAPNGMDRESLLDLKQDGATLSGMLSSERGKAPVTSGRVEGGELILEISRKGNGDEVPVTLRGVRKGDSLYLSLAFRAGEPLAAIASR